MLIKLLKKSVNLTRCVFIDVVDCDPLNYKQCLLAIYACITGTYDVIVCCAAMIDGHLKCDCLNDMVRYVETCTIITSKWRNWLTERKTGSC